MSAATDQILCFERWFDVELTRPQQLRYVPDTLFYGDNSANLIGARVYKNGEPYSVPVGSIGNVTGYCLHENGQTTTVSGTATGNEVYIILPQAAYSQPEEILKITVRATVSDGDGVTASRQVVLVAIAAKVIKAQSSNTPAPVIPADPSDPLVTYAVIAAPFDPTFSYNIGDYCTYNNRLHVRVTMTEPEGDGSWVGAHWRAVTVGDALTNERMLTENAIDNEHSINQAIFAAPFSTTSRYFVGDYCTYANTLKRCVADITTPGVWNGLKWKTVTVGEILGGFEKRFRVDEDRIGYAVVRTVNLYNPVNNMSGVQVYSTDGKLYTNSEYVTTDFIDVEPGQRYLARYWVQPESGDGYWGTRRDIGACAAYTIDGTHMGGSTDSLWKYDAEEVGYLVPVDCSKLRFCMHTTVDGLNVKKVVLARVDRFPASYTDYWKSSSFSVQDTDGDGNIVFVL